jgi:hypothetical protein
MKHYLSTIANMQTVRNFEDRKFSIVGVCSSGIRLCTEVVL